METITKPIEPVSPVRPKKIRKPMPDYIPKPPREKICEFIDQSKTLMEVWEHFKVSRQTLLKWMRLYSIPVTLKNSLRPVKTDYLVGYTKLYNLDTGVVSFGSLTFFDGDLRQIYHVNAVVTPYLESAMCTRLKNESGKLEVVGLQIRVKVDEKCITSNA